jgi:hypothetical protein
MSDRAESTAGAPQLHAALLDYYRAPGKYQLTLRQPALLFASVREILQLAAGREAEAATPGQAAELRDAAAFFVRAALLFPGADHYAVFALPARTEPVELKERYRLLMRLTHPDFASGASAAWSADAAVRVNRAYEVLSSPVLRREYDEQLAGVRASTAAEAVPPRPAFTPPPRREQRQWQLNPKAAWMLAAGVAALAVVLLLPGPETPHLVQKSPQARPLPQVAQSPAPAETSAAVLIPADVLPPATAREAVPATALQEPPPEPPAPAPGLLAQAAPRAPAAPVAPAPLPAPRSAVAPAATLQAPAPAPAVARAPAAPPAVAPAPAPAPAAASGPTAAELAAAHRRAKAEAGSRPAIEPPPIVARAPAPVPPAPVRTPEAPAVVAAAPVAPPSPLAAPVPAPRVTPVAASPAAPTLNDAQPLLTQLLHLLESGNGDQVLRLLEGDARHAASAQALSRQYEQLVRGARPVRLSHVEFRSEARDGVLLVTGRIRLHAGEPTIGSLGERLLLRAEFQARGGKVLLTGLAGAPD